MACLVRSGMAGPSKSITRAERWLANPRGLDPFDVVGLIHRINPTGRVEHEETKRARYRLKSALQSALLREWPDAFEVRGTPDEDVISLIHRLSGRDAGHAPLASLDADVLPHVRSELALRADAAELEPRPSGARREDAAGALDRAKEEGDYEGAAGLLEPAARAGDVEAGRQRLELLLDYLDDPRACLDAARRLPASDDPELCRLVALAHIRLGALERGRRLLADRKGRAVGRCWVELATRALDAGDGALARRALDGLLFADPSARGTARPLQERCEALLEAPRLPLRAAVEQAWAAGAGVSEALDALLEAFPDDEQGAHWRSRLERARAAERQAAACARARALLEDDPQAALVTLHGAGAGGEVPALRARARELLAARQLDARIEAVRAMLRVEPLTAEALEAWRSLDARSRVRVGVERAELRWVAELRTARGVPAALALMEAAEAIALGDADGARALLEPHTSLVRRLADGRDIQDALEDATERSRDEARQRAAEAGRAAFGRGELDEARALLLEAGPAASDFVEEVEARLAERAEVRAWEQLRSDGPAWRAWERARIALDDVPDDPIWLARERQARDDVRRACRTHGRAGGGRLGSWEIVPCVSGSAMQWLWRGHLVAVESWGSWVRVRLCALPALEVQRTAVFRAPDGLAARLAVHVEGDALFLIDQEGRIVEVDLRRSTPVRWGQVAEVLGHSGLSICDRTLWLCTRRGGVVALNLDTYGIRRRDRGSHLVAGMPGAPQLVHLRGARLAIADRSGRIVRSLARHSLGQFLGVAWDPHHGVPIVLGRTHEHVLTLGTWRGDRFVVLWRRPEPPNLAFGVPAVDAEERTLFAVWGGHGGAHLMALDLEGEVLWSVEVPSGTLLVQDGAGGPVYAVSRHEYGGPRVVRLGGAPPELDAEWGGMLPALYEFGCGRYRCRSALSEQVLAAVRERPEHIHHVINHEQGRGGDLIELVEGALIGGLCVVPYLDEAEGELVLEDPVLRLLYADHMIVRRQGADALELLERTPAELLPPELRPHRAHVLAIALARTGDLAGARAALREAALAREHTCLTAGTLQIVDACSDPAPHRADSPAVAQMKLMARALRGPPEALEDEAVCARFEAHLAARSAERWLERRDGAVLDKAWALARVAKIWSVMGAFELVGPGTLAFEDLGALARRAAEWLDGDATLPEEGAGQ